MKKRGFGIIEAASRSCSLPVTPGTGLAGLGAALAIQAPLRHAPAARLARRRLDLVGRLVLALPVHLGLLRAALVLAVDDLVDELGAGARHLQPRVRVGVHVQSRLATPRIRIRIRAAQRSVIARQNMFNYYANYFLNE